MKCMLMVLLIIISVNGGRRSRKRIHKGGFKIIQDKKQYKVKLNDDICLPCRVNVDAKKYDLLFYWTKNNKLLCINDKRYESLENKCLFIRNVTSTDHGKYLCHAYIILKSLERLEFKVERQLIVKNRDPNATAPAYTIEPSRGNEPPKTKLIHIRYQTVGKKLKLQCSIGSLLQPCIRWYHNSKLVKPSKGVRIRKTFSLVVKRFTRKFIGNYTCVAKDKINDDMKSINVSYIVKLKMNILKQVTTAKTSSAVLPTFPALKVLKLYFTKGDNMTLNCTAQKNFQVAYLLWYKISKTKELIREANIKDNTKQLSLFNITKEITYSCMGFNTQNPDTPTPLLMVSLKLLRGTDLQKERKTSEKHPTLLLMIGVPVFAGLLSIIIIILCFRCHRKTVNETIILKTDHDNEDALSMEILPVLPTGSFRVHEERPVGFLCVHEDHKTGLARKHEKEDCPVITYPCLQKGHCSDSIEKHHTTERLNNSPKLHSSQQLDASSKNSRLVDSFIPITGLSNNVQTSTWPGQKLLPGDPDYIIFTETDHSIQNSKKKSIDNSNVNNRTKIKHKNDENVKDIKTKHSGVTDDNIPDLQIPDAPEEDDYLLQREMKNWEPLIRDSSTYNKKVEETYSLLSTCCVDELENDDPSEQIII